MPIEQKDCPVCSSTSRAILPVLHEWDETEWQLIRCTECGHRYTDPVPTDSELVRMYDKDYFTEGGSWVCGFWKGSYESNELNLRQEARGLLPPLPDDGGTLLEIGCAGGFFLDEAKKHGWDVRGSELNHEMVEYGRDTLGLDIHEGLFELAGFHAGSFNVVIAQDVLEHTRDPKTFVRNAAILLKTGGSFIIRGPLEETARERVYHAIRRFTRRGVLRLPEPPFHLQGFCKESFTRTVEGAGLALSSLSASSTPPRWVLSSPKAIVATVIEQTCYRFDRWHGKGDFMIATSTTAQ